MKTLKARILTLTLKFPHTCGVDPHVRGGRSRRGRGFPHLRGLIPAGELIYKTIIGRFPHLRGVDPYRIGFIQ